MADNHTTEEEPIETVRVREVVGVLHTHEDLDTVVRGLTSAGFNRADIDLMASRDAILRKLKTMYRKPVEAAEIPGVPRRELVLPDDTVTTSALVFGTLITIGTLGELGAALPILATGGAVASAVGLGIAGGAAATGLAKIVRDRIVHRSEAVNLENELRLGGLVVFVRVRDPEEAEKALTILQECGATDVHVHEVELPKTAADIPLAKCRAALNRENEAVSRDHCTLL